jgi:choline dehydrogenase
MDSIGTVRQAVLRDYAARVRERQQELAAKLETRYDYVVCGAGTAGCVVASRLGADLKTRVLVLEAGGSDELHIVSDPDRWPMTLGSELDWGFVAEPNPHLNGRAIPYSMGKVLGGGSSVNVSTWSRGHRADWDHYASETADAAWSYGAVLDLYRRRIEAYVGTPDPDYRGLDGMVHVQPVSRPHPFAFAFLEGAESVGLKRYPNSNGRLMEAAGGCALVDETVSHGERRSIFRSYLYPRMIQPNVTVLTGATARRVGFEGRRATSIEFEHRGRIHKIQAGRDIVLSLGAIHTPKLLMQSGVGDEAELRRFGIPVVQALPGVGRGLHDHVSFGLVFENAEHLPPAAPRSQIACFWKTDATLDAPNFHASAWHGAAVTPENAARLNPPSNAWTMVVGMRPRSRGSIHLTGSEPSAPLKIDANYLADPGDLRELMGGLCTARDIARSAALQPYTGREIAPATSDHAELERFLRDGLVTCHHQSGTARMGRDPLSVVDGRLRVHGLEGLRIADASVLPRVTSGNTMAPCVVIGEQAAAFLRKDGSSESGRVG